MEKQKTKRRTVWHFLFSRSENEISASIWEIEEKVIENYVSEQFSVSKYGRDTIVSRFFDTEEDARKYYDEFTASAYSFDLEKLKGGVL